jgi:hypothetical protein
MAISGKTKGDLLASMEDDLMRYTEDCVPALPTGAWGARFVTEQGERNHQAVRCAGGIRSAQPLY